MHDWWRGTLQPRHRRILVDPNAELQCNAPHATHPFAGMDRRRGRVIDAGQEGGAAGLARDLLLGDLAERRQIMLGKAGDNAAPRSDMAWTGRAPDPAVAAKLGLDIVRDAEFLDVAGGFAEMMTKALGAVGAAEGFQRGE